MFKGVKFDRALDADVYTTVGILYRISDLKVKTSREKKVARASQPLSLLERKVIEWFLGSGSVIRYLSAKQK